MESKVLRKGHFTLSGLVVLVSIYVTQADTLLVVWCGLLSSHTNGCLESNLC